MAWRGWENYTPPSMAKPSKLAKYRAQPTTIDGIRFDSKREANRYVDLCMQRDRGLISDLELQPQFPLSVVTPDGTKVIIGRYIADFRYRRDGELIVEDAKGFRGKELYVWKKKHVEAEYGIAIRET